MTPTRSSHRLRLGATVAATTLLLGLSASMSVAAPSSQPAAGGQENHLITAAGLQPGQVKHVWLIILENKSYDATFSGLNQNSYLWKTLPSQGALLQNYFGTGHYSQDNYTAMTSGQSASFDLQEDCSEQNFDFGSNSTIITDHTGTAFGRTDNYGQVLSGAGPNAANGKNGCTYPHDVPTLFNQFDAAGVTWKGYAQDLHNQVGREDGLCGAPGTAQNDPTNNPRSMADKPSGVQSFTGAQANDQYVAKHFPFPWFHSLIGDALDGSGALTSPVGGGYDCDAHHIANLDDTSNGLIADLSKSADQVPAFSWISPNNCSDAHDATCKGNNMSGLFDANGNPDYSLPLNTAPKNYTGGLYAADLWLRYYIPLIERSAAFKDGGLIDVTFDEANPPFTNMSFNNATDKTAATQGLQYRYQYSLPTMNDFANESKNTAAGVFPTPNPIAKNFIQADLAGQNINGMNVDWEPTGPNSTLDTDAHGNQLYPGPGANGYIQRPRPCDDPNAIQGACVEGAKNVSTYNFRKQATKNAAAPAGASTIAAAVSIGDMGRGVSGAGIPADSFVGQVTNSGPNMVASASDPVTTASFELVDRNGNPAKTTAALTSITLSATGTPGHLQAGETPESTFDAQDATPGGGDTGSVLISPLIKPGTVSTTYYNHYSWLRTMEDIFQVSKGTDTKALAAGTVSGGLDGLGHLGFAAQAGLAPFGTDVFNNLPAATVPVHNATPPAKGVALPATGGNHPWDMGVAVAIVALAGLVFGWAWLRRPARSK